jgi:hypothetical protein
MEPIIFSIIIVALIAYGLERNRRRVDAPRSLLAGSSDVIDRDSERFYCELRAKL